MKYLDRIFRIILAQTYRAKDGEDIEAARWRAVNKLMGYLAFPIIAAVGLVMLLTHWWVDSGASYVAKGPWQITGIFVYVMMYSVLSRRYRAYSPPLEPLSTLSPEDHRYLWRFRCAAIGSFIAVTLVPLVKHLAAR